MSLIQYMRFVRWAVMRDSLVRVGAYEAQREMRNSCTSGEMVGRVLAEIWREWREWRKSRVKAGENFFLVLLVVTLMQQLFRVWSLFPVLASLQRCSSTTLKDDRLMPVGWRWGASCRVRTVRVGISRVRSGSFLFLVLALDFEHDSTLPLLGCGQFTVLQGPRFAIRLPANGSHGFMMTSSQQSLIVLWAQGNYITVFDATALLRRVDPRFGVEAVWRGNDAGDGRMCLHRA